MNYVEAVTNYLRAHDVPVGTVLPDHPEVPMHEIVSCPRPFKQGEALALQEVCKCALQNVKTLQVHVPLVQAVIAPTLRPEDSVSIRIGFYGVSETESFVIGPEGGDVLIRPLPRVQE